MFCLNCGAQNDENAKFCISCGIKMHLDDEHATSNATSQVEANASIPNEVPISSSTAIPPPPQYQNAANQQNQNANNRPLNVVPLHQYNNQAGYVQNSPITDEHVSVAGWLGRYCIILFPFIGPIIFIVMLFVWGFGDTPKKSLKNWARANLLFLLILVVLILLALIIFAIAGFSLYDSVFRNAFRNLF